MSSPMEITIAQLCRVVVVLWMRERPSSLESSAPPTRLVHSSFSCSTFAASYLTASAS